MSAAAAHDKQGYLDDRCLDKDIKFLKEPYNPFLPHSSSTQSVPELFERIFSIISNSSHSLISLGVTPASETLLSADCRAMYT